MSREAVFLDTSGLIAAWSANDQWHARARPVLAELARVRTRLATTNLVLLECGNSAARRPSRYDVIALRNRLRAARWLIEPTEEDVDAAWDAYARGEAGQAGIVDLVSFVVMRRLGLTRAFTNDAHSRAAGFETLF